jgi:hypothetical protein
MNKIDYFSISEAITELSKIGQNEIVTKLENILENNEVKKPELHNKKDDKTTSYYRVNLTEEELEVITDLFLDLEVGSLTEEGEAENSTERYVTLLNNWSNISGETASL